MLKTIYKKPFITITYFTDPVCSTCWIFDTYLSKLMQEYHGIATVDVKMGGMLKSWEELEFKDKTIDKAHQIRNLWSNASAKYGICLDGELWCKQPIASSYPASIAFYAAKMQGQKIALEFLSTIKEMLFLYGKDISTDEIILTAALNVDLNIGDFLKCIESGSANDLFSQDLKLKENLNVSEFPTLIFSNEEGTSERGLLFSGEQSVAKHYSNWENIIERLTNGRALKHINNINAREVLKVNSRLSEQQICILTGKRVELIRKELQKLQSEGIVVLERAINMNYWRYNDTTYRIKKSNLNEKQVAIIGGGVGGLFVGVAARRAGVDASIFERKSNYEHKGLGFILLDNGLNALDSVGLKNEVMRIGHSINTFKAVEPSGELILHRNLRNCLSFRREHLIALLLNEIDQNKLYFNHNFKNLNELDSKYSIHFEDSPELTPDIIIASDGINSKIRNEIFQGSQLSIVKEREIVGTSHCEDICFLEDEFIKIVDVDNGLYMGVLPLGKNDFIWFIQFNDENFQIDFVDFDSLLNFSLSIAEKYPDQYKKVIASTNKNELVLSKSKRMNLLPAFHKNNIVLLGDAAHPLLPFTSQGLNSALEDGAALISILTNQDSSETIETAFEDYYENRRLPIAHYIKEGDMLLNDFVNLSSNTGFNLPLSIH